MVDDRELVRRAQQGDREAVGALYAAYHPRVYRYIAYRVGDQGTADDLTAEVFLTMVRKIHDFEDRGRPLLAWLYTVAGNLVKMHYRKLHKHPSEKLRDEMIDHQIGPADLVNARLNHGRLLEALPQLSNNQQEVIILKFIEGLTNAEVAAILGKTEGAIRILQHRALLALRQTLLDKEGVSHGVA